MLLISLNAHALALLTLLLMVFLQLQLLPFACLWLLSRIVLVFELIYGFEDILLLTNGAIATTSAHV